VIGVAGTCTAGERLLPASGARVAYVDEAGDEHQGPLGELWHVAFERASPARPFGSFRAQRSFQGSWWFSTTDELVGFESWVERDQLMMLDFDPEVVAVSSQPFWLSWAGEGRARRHAPDYFARSADGSAVVIDVRPDELVGPADAEVFAATELACGAVGWRYRRCGVVPAVLAANVRWLAGYRHRRCLNVPIATSLVERLEAAPAVVAETVEAVGGRLSVLPTLFHLLWRGVITADVASAALSGGALLSVGRRAT
jgi:hypothetical protein